jgi:hypothetical protein
MPSFGLLHATIPSCIGRLLILFGVRKLARPQLYGQHQSDQVCAFKMSFHQSTEAA